jgi:hypothetical protein
MNPRAGSAWSLIDPSQLAGQVGADDLGTLLVRLRAPFWLVILGPADRWVPHDDVLAAESGIVRREGHALVEHADGSSHMLNH